MIVHRVRYRATLSLLGQRNFNPSAVRGRKRADGSETEQHVLKRYAPEQTIPVVEHFIGAIRERSGESVRRAEACRVINLCIEHRYPRARSSWRYLNGASVIGEISNKRFGGTQSALRWIPKVLSSARARVT